MKAKRSRWAIFLVLLLGCITSTNCGTVINLAGPEQRLPMGGVIIDTTLLVQEGFQDP